MQFAFCQTPAALQQAGSGIFWLCRRVSLVALQPVTRLYDGFAALANPLLQCVDVVGAGASGSEHT